MSRSGRTAGVERRFRQVPGAARERAPRRTAEAPSDLGRRLVTEALGTGLLVLFGAGSIVAALGADGGTITYAALGMISIAFAVIVAVVIYAFGSTSGAHINPAVTITLAARGRFPAGEVLPYIGAQVVGGFAGALLIVAVFGAGATDVGTGGTTLADGVPFLRGVVAEAAGTYLLVLAVFALAVDRRAPAGWAGFVIGLAVACAILLIGPVTGGSMNPARTFGPLVVTTLWAGETAWGDLPVYIIGPLVGGLLAGLTYDLVSRPREAEAAERAQGTAGDITGHREATR